MPNYSVYLSTVSSTPTNNQAVPTDRSNLAYVKWNLNWDAIFRMENYKYQKCRLRIKLQSRSFSGNDTDWNTYMGYITCPLQSMTSGFGSYGTVISTSQAVGTPHTSTSVLNCIIADTTESLGVDVIPPQGNEEFFLRFNRIDLSSGLLISNLTDYQVVLFFELYEEIKST